MGDSIKKVLSQESQKLRPNPLELDPIKKFTNEFITNLEKEIGLQNMVAEVFLGGSFAKGTFLKSDIYDVDIFVRFDWKYVQLSESLAKLIIPLSKKLNLKTEVIHGSRDYFRVYHPNSKGYFEVIPVTRIKKPQEERNVTDLTYFHGPYVTKRIKGLEDQVRLAKQFFKAQRAYGAETYVRGFSGYSVELLIIKYKSFLKMIKELMKFDSTQRAVIDIEKAYKNKNEVFIHVNEAKLHSPIILIDPTYKERNALAALSRDTLVKIQKSIKLFLKKPSLDFFVLKEPNAEILRKNAIKNKQEFLPITLTTDKQHGDIAGTKMKKFAEVLHRELNLVFDVKNTDFFYTGEQSSVFYISLIPKKEIIRIGPPREMKKHATRFKSQHSVTFIKNKRLHARLPVLKNARAFLHSWKLTNKNMMQQMHILSMNIN
ncbi:MAG: nucleotidyltransferase domain-containing protein [Candidatus Pacearchaeota archaeon]